MKIVVVVGNPKAASRTLDAAVLLAEKLGAKPEVIDLALLGPGLMNWGDAPTAEAIAQTCAADVAIFASPTYKATYTGLLKLFLDQFSPNALDGVYAIPLMLGAGPVHALAPELLLKPVLVELGALCPFAGLYLIDKSFSEDPRLDSYVERALRFPLFAGASKGN